MIALLLLVAAGVNAKTVYKVESLGLGPVRGNFLRNGTSVTLAAVANVVGEVLEDDLKEDEKKWMSEAKVLEHDVDKIETQSGLPKKVFWIIVLVLLAALLWCCCSVCRYIFDGLCCCKSKPSHYQQVFIIANFLFFPHKVLSFSFLLATFNTA